MFSGLWHGMSVENAYFCTTMKKFYSTGLLLLMLFLPTGSKAQKPAAVSSEVQQALLHFGDRQDAKSARQFLALLHKENFTEEEISFAAATPRDTLRAQVWYWAAEYFYAAGSYQEARNYALMALPLLKQGHDETMLADCLNVLAINNARLGRYPEAIDYARQVYNLDMKSGDEERISMSLNTLAGLYVSARQPQEAEKYVVKGLEMARRSGLEHRQAIVEGMAAEMYHALGRDSLAADYAEAAYEKEIHLGRTHKAMIRLSQKAAALIGLKRYAEAEKLLTTAIDYFREHGGQQQSLAISLNQRGKARLALSRSNTDGDRCLHDAKADFREAAELLAEMGDRYGEMHARQGLYECLYQTQPDSARREMDRFIALRDSLYDMASAESLARYNAEFGNDFLHEKISVERSMRQRIVAGILTGLAVLCIVIVLQLRRARNYRMKQQQRMHELMAQIEDSRKKPAPETPKEQDGQHEQPQQEGKQEQEQEQKQELELDLEQAQQEGRQEPSAANAEFLKNTNAVIHRLMSGGQVDTASVASELCLSTSQFRRRISAATGLTAANYILMIRMDEAKQLLGQYPKYTINEIAQRCGFADNAHFTHTFKRIFRITPSEYTREDATHGRIQGAGCDASAQ